MKKYRILSALTAIVLLCLMPFPPLRAHAESGRIGNDITWELKDGVLTLTGTGATDSFQSQQNSPLYAVRLDISEIVIGEGITELGSNVFTTVFFKLKSLTLPDSLRRIGSNNFTGNALEEINLPPALEYIGEHAFEASTGITELVIPDSVQEIGDYAFNAAHSVTSLTLPNHNLKLGRGTFQGFTALETVQLPDTLTEIPDNLFSACPEMLEIQIPSSCTRIGMNAFHMTGLCEIDIPGSVREIGADAFSDCISIRSITLHEGTEILGDGCFADCCAAEIHVPESVKYIGKDCFSDTNVETLTLPTHKDLQVAEGALPENWLKSQEGFLVLGDGILYQYREHAETEAATETAPEPKPAVSLPKPAANEYSGKIGDNITWEYTDGTLTLTGTGATYSYQDHHKSPIRYHFKKLIISEGITALGDNIFQPSGMETEELVFPDSLKRIGDNTFKNNYFSRITLPPHLESIGDGAFANSYNITEMVFPDSVREIGANAFSGCGNLKHITLPEQNIEFGKAAFQGCNRLQSAELPDAVTQIPNQMFMNCRSLRSVHIPENCVSIGMQAFSQTILEEIDIPANTKDVSGYAFQNCRYLKTINIQEGVESLGECCFDGCSAPEIHLPDSLKYIGKDCFSDRFVRTLTLPDNQELLAEENSLPENWLKTQTGFLIVGSILYQYREEAEPVEFSDPDIYVLEGRLGDDITWKYDDNTIFISGTGATYPERTGMITQPLFVVDKIVIGEGITEIGDGALYNPQWKIREIELPDSLKRVGKNFIYSYNLKSLNLPPHLESIGEGAFSNLGQITELTIPDSVTEIGSGAFLDCYYLREVHLPDSLTEIPEYMFVRCNALREINIPASCTRIGDNAFTGAAFTAIDIPGSVKEIGASAFEGCWDLSDITLHEGLEKLGDRCFYNCPAKDVSIPESVKEIGADCFYQEERLSTQSDILYGTEASNDIAEDTESSTEPTTYTEAVIPSPALPEPAAEVQSGKLGDNITWEIKDDTLTLTGTGATYSYDDYRDTPFYGLKTPERIIIGEGITEIGDNALCAFDRSTLVDFVKQGANKEIVFPDSLLRIGEMNFEGFEGDQLILPPALEYIGEDAFSSMLHVTELVIPESVKEIGACAFSSSPLLQKVKLPDTDIRLREQVFAGCWALSEIHLPDRMTEIPSSLLNGCLNLREVRIPPQVTCIGYSAFSYCGLKKIELPESVKEIKDGAFENCAHLSEVTLNDGLETIGKDAFRGCPIVELQIPESVTTLEEFFCSSAAPNIPDQIQTLKLPTHKDLQLAENALPQTWVEAQKGFLVLGDGLLYHYTADGDSDTLIVPDGVKVIYPAAFDGLHIKTLILPDTVQEIRSKAFVGCEIDTIIFKGQVDFIAADMLSNSKVQKIQSKYYTNGQVFAMDSGIPFVPSEADQPGTPKTPDPETELLPFGNNGGVFGETYQMNDETRKVLLNYTLKSHIESVKEDLAKPWGGSCFGLSTVTMLVQSGMLPLSALDPDAKTLHDVKPGTQAVDIINYYQMTNTYLQYLYHINYPNERTQFQKLCHIIRCANEYNNDGTPFVITIQTKGGGGHAVVGYGIESGSWEWNDQVYSRRIRIWDSNYEGLDDRCCIYFDPDSLHFTLPAYGIVYNMNKTADTGCINMVHNNPADFCAYPIPSQLIKGDLNRDQQTTIADAVLFARYLAEDSELPADVYRNVFLADYNADDIFDYTDLMKLLSAITTKAA